MRKSRIGYAEVNKCEVYLYWLRKFFEQESTRSLNGYDANALSIEIRRKLLNEIKFMELAINLYDSFTGGRGVVIYAAKEQVIGNVFFKRDFATTIFYRFGNVQVASRAMEIPIRQIHRVCQGVRQSAHGWRFSRTPFDEPLVVGYRDQKPNLYQT